MIKKRLALWGILLSTASIATAMSFYIPQRHLYTNAEIAEQLGVSVDEMIKVRRMGYQMGSDLHNHRPVNDKDVQYLLNLAYGGSKLGNDVMWQFLVLKGTKYQVRARKIAFKWSSSPDENVAFVAIDELRNLDDPRWFNLAKSYPWKTKDYPELLLQSRNY